MVNLNVMNLQQKEKMMTPQEIFDTVSKHLLTMPKQSKEEPVVSLGDSRCLYRSPEGLKCAIGILISDELYDPQMDTGIATGIQDIVKKYNHLPSFFKYNLALLMQLQRVHDRASNWLDNKIGMIDELCEIGQEHDLNSNVINETIVKGEVK